MPPAEQISRNPLLLDGRSEHVRTGHYLDELYRFMPMGVRAKTALTAFINKVSVGNKPLDDPLFYWWQKPWNQRQTDIIDVYNGPGLTTATSSASASGSTRVLAMTEAMAKPWIKGHQIRVTKFADAGFLQVSGSVIALVEGVTIGGDANSYLTVTLLETDTNNVLSGAYLKGAPAGQQHGEVHTLPESVFQDVTRVDGACSAMLGAYQMSDYARKMKVQRGGIKALTEMKMDALTQMLIDKEMHCLHGIYSATNPEQLAAGGLEYYIKQREPSAGYNMVDALTDTIYLTSAQTGPAYTWIYELLEGIVDYGTRWIDAPDYRCYHGGEVGMVINAMIRDKGIWNLGETTGVDEYGLSFTKLKFQNGTITFYEHPLFKHNPANHGRAILVPETGIQQVTFMPFEEIPSDIMDEEGARRAKRTGSVWSSVGKGGFREVCGWKFNGVEGMFIIDNIHRKLNR